MHACRRVFWEWQLGAVLFALGNTLNFISFGALHETEWPAHQRQAPAA